MNGNRNGSVRETQLASGKSKLTTSPIKPTASARKGDKGPTDLASKSAPSNARNESNLAKAGKAAPRRAASDAVDITGVAPSGVVKYGLRNIDDLKPFPLQSMFYGQESKADDDHLEQALRAGQTERIPIMPSVNLAGLPKNTMLDGHRRWQLWKKIGTKQIKVVVRHDLADADFDTVEAEFLTFNFNRRQLHAIDKARIAKRLFEIEKGRSRGGLHPSEDAEARERVGKVIGLCGRELQRYLRLLQTPIEVQNAVRNKHLPLTLAEKVERLTKEQQAELVERITAILAIEAENPHARRQQKAELKNVVKAYVQPNSPGIDVQCRLWAVFRAIENLDGYTDEIPHYAFRGQDHRLEQGRRVWKQLIGRAKEPDPYDE